MTKLNYPQVADQMLAFENCTIEKIANAHPDVIAELRKLDRIKTAATFAGLLAMPGLQANCFRIEALVHLAVAHCEGRMTPTKAFVCRSFERLGEGYCGRMEDPAEDVFITLVNTPRGNFRIFEGVREGTGFHLQRILNIVDKMPERPPFNQIRSSIECMLKLSDEVAARADVRENSLGEELPLGALPTGVADQLSLARGLIRFSEDDLTRLEVPLESLTEFVFSADHRFELRAQMIGHTEHERRPIALHGQSAHLLLPTAVASAITRFVIESVLSMGLADTFERALSEEFAQLFDQTPILGGATGAPIMFQRIGRGRVAEIESEVDPGRFLQIVFFVDGLDGFLKDGLAGSNSDSSFLSLALNEHLKRGSARAMERTSFRDGISLIVGCGFGRGLDLARERNLPDHWRLEMISAYDLVTLSWVSGFHRLSLWRLLDSLKAIEREGAALLNINGLLNLVAWSEQLGGHLVPHGKLPDGFVQPGTEALIVIPQNAIRDLRHRVLMEWNPRRVLDPDGRWVRVRKLSHSEFEEDSIAPLYGSEDDLRNRRLRGVYVAPNHPWWVEVAVTKHAPSNGLFDHWMMLCTWLSRAAPILDQAYTSLRAGPIIFHVSFDDVVGNSHGITKPKNADELQSLIQNSVEAGCSRIGINIGKGFDDGLLQPENIAERTLVEALVAGAAGAADELDNINKRQSLVDRICPNPQARYHHRFQARSFRDFVHSEISSDPILVDSLDDAASRIGLGWRVRSRDRGPEISGVAECTSYLNDVVREILDDICAELKSLDRRSFARLVLQNHEVAAHDRDRWSRSAQANLAMHENKEAAVRTIVEHQSRLNACFLASRILLEAAICECPLEGGRNSGRLDLSRLMSRALQAHYLGGWSDAVHWGAMEPRVRITPLGDVHMNHSYMDTVYEPFGRLGGEAAVKEATDSYARLYAPVEVRASIADVFDPQFLSAWDAEFGASLDGVRAFVDQLEDLGQKPPKAMLESTSSALDVMLASAAGISLQNASVALDVLTSAPRPEWRIVGGKFKDKDWYPWRFRRRLSILRRPLIQIDRAEDPNIIFAPGLVREAFAAVLSWFYRGEIPSSQARSDAMCKWIGQANNVNRVKFNSTVARRMAELGWQVEPEVKLTKILGRSLERDYGDIDVLAWRPDSGRVLVIECKDVQYHKTLGEVAEQLSDFRGEVRPDGKPDHLKRHLNRLEVLAEHKLTVSKALKLASPIQMEGHLVFKNPVPMRFAWDQMASRIRLSLFAELNQL